MAPHRRAVPGGDRESGTLSVFVALVVTGLVLVIGIVIDASGRLQAGVNIDEYANEAARAGAEQVDAGDAISGRAIAIDCSRQDTPNAYSAVASYLSGTGLAGQVTQCSAKSVTVTIRGSYKGLLFPGTFPVTGTGTATLYAAQNQAPAPEQQP
jgi:Flp pilus assembly protein TadG